MTRVSCTGISHNTREVELRREKFNSRQRPVPKRHSFSGWNKDARTGHAAHLLADTEMPVEQIAKQVGFDTATGFSTFFRRQTGISPTEYRRQMRTNCMKNPSQMENLRFEET